jgi:hypothetical protein
MAQCHTNEIQWSLALQAQRFVPNELGYSILSYTELTCLATTFPLPKPYFSPFHLAVVSDDDSNMRFFRKFSMRRRLVMLKWFFLSRQFEIIECFNSSILVILHSLFVSFSLLFDLNDDTFFIYEIRIFQKLEKLLINDVFDRWSHLMNFC